MTTDTSLKLKMVATIFFLVGLILMMTGALNLIPPLLQFIGAGCLALAVLLRLIAVLGSKS